jgi:hypothetical protein
MTIGEMIEKLQLEVASGPAEALRQEVSGGYASDLLSNVMGQAKAGNVWVTMQGHQNIVAVASLAGLAAVIIAGQAMPDEDTLKKAREREIVLLTTPLPAFEIIGRLHRLGVGGQ